MALIGASDGLKKANENLLEPPRWKVDSDGGIEAPVDADDAAFAEAPVFHAAAFADVKLVAVVVGDLDVPLDKTLARSAGDLCLRGRGRGSGREP